MTPSQQVKLFCKQHQIAVKGCRVSRTVMLSKNHPAGAMWIEVFDDYKDAYTFLCKHHHAEGAKPWHTPNYK